MKLVVAIIQPHKLSAVKQALIDAEILRMTVTNALGLSEEAGRTEMYRGIEEYISLRKKVRIELALNDDFVEPAIEAILKGGRTGDVGDGKIFVLDLPQCIRIRTLERGTKAIG
jgi:nitrogen regulatory protein P-II 2